MKIYIGQINGIIPGNKSFTSLKDACEHYGVGYQSALKGKRVWVDSSDVVTKILEIEVVRAKSKVRSGSH